MRVREGERGATTYAVPTHPPEKPIGRVRRDRGLVLIIAYKFVKGVLWLIFAGTILIMMRLGLEGRLDGLAHHLRHHAHAWSLALADLVVRVPGEPPRHVLVAGEVVVEDGKLVRADLEEIRARAREEAAKLFRRMDALR